MIRTVPSAVAPPSECCRERSYDIAGCTRVHLLGVIDNVADLMTIATVTTSGRGPISTLLNVAAGPTSSWARCCSDVSFSTGLEDLSRLARL